MSAKMSLSGLRLVGSVFSSVVRSNGCLSRNVAGAVVRASFCQSSSSRSLWSLVSASYGSPRNNYLAQAGRNSRTWMKSQAYALHTTGDHELADFLKDEIKLEKEHEKKIGSLPKIKNFEVTKTDGPTVELTRKMDRETITIKFNVNNSVQGSSGAMEGEGEHEEQGSQMVSKPAFVVEINKGGDMTLAVHCVFPLPEDVVPAAEHDQNEQYEDLIEIQDVTLLKKSQEWTDDVYTLSSVVMDGNLYDMLLHLLEERGVDGDFVAQVVDFSTAYEHRKYVELLEQLKEFADSK